MWVHHHTTQQSTQDIPPPINQTPTITNNHKHHHQHPTHQPSTPTQPTKHAQPSLAPVLLVARPPGCVPSGGTLGNIASQPASQPATSYQPTADSRQRPAASGQRAADSQSAANGQRAVGPGAGLEPPKRPQTPHASKPAQPGRTARNTASRRRPVSW